MGNPLVIGLLTIGDKEDAVEDKRIFRERRTVLLPDIGEQEVISLLAASIDPTVFYAGIGSAAMRCIGNNDKFLAKVEQYVIGQFYRPVDRIVYALHLGNSAASDWLHPPFADVNWIPLEGMAA
jgi:hypothetical protein